MNIPDKAVQAAAKADYETNPGMLEWEEMHPKDQEIFIHSAEASLKAAAPFIAAQALRDAVDEVDTMRSGPAAAPYVSATKAVLRSIADQWAEQ